MVSLRKGAEVFSCSAPSIDSVSISVLIYDMLAVILDRMTFKEGPHLRMIVAGGVSRALENISIAQAFALKYGVMKHYNHDQVKET